MEKHSFHIGVFDSGVGGLSIWKSLRAAFPDACIDYCSDSKNFPYGTKSEIEVIQNSTTACIAFHKKSKFDVLVVACGTASTIALPSLREALPCPVIGVVPAIKPAAIFSQTKCIGLLATKATVDRPYTKGLVKDFASDCEVRMCGSSLLVDLAEKKIRGHQIDVASIRSEISSLFQGSEKKIDVIVLGCTHFPLLLEELLQAVPFPVTFIDSSDAIARRIKDLFGDRLKFNDFQSRALNSSAYSTDAIEKTFAPGIPNYLKTLGLSHWFFLEV